MNLPLALVGSCPYSYLQPKVALILFLLPSPTHPHLWPQVINKYILQFLISKFSHLIFSPCLLFLSLLAPSTIKVRFVLQNSVLILCCPEGLLFLAFPSYLHMQSTVHPLHLLPGLATLLAGFSTVTSHWVLLSSRVVGSMNYVWSVYVS